MLSKFGKLSIREILVVASAYVHPYSLLRRAKGVSRQPEGGVENAIFSWREIARCF